MRRSRLWLGSFVLAAHVIIASHAVAQPATRRDPFVDPASGPFSLKEVLDLVTSVKQGVESEGRILRAIDARGVAFPITSEAQFRLEQAGASTKVTDLIKKKAPPPVQSLQPLPPPPPQLTGTLTLQCEPAECDISVQGGRSISTTNGAVSIPGVKTGEVVLDFKKQGYFGQQQTLVVRANVATYVAVKLDPDNPSQATFGKRLFEGMQQAAGAANRKTVSTLSVAGSATVIDRAGTSSEWNFTATFRPGQATLEVSGVAGRLRLDCRGETCEANSGKKTTLKGLSPEHTLALETGLRQFRKWQFAVLSDRLLSDELRPTAKAAEPSASGEQSLRLEGSNESFNVTLDARLLPILVTFESKSGLDSGLTLAFADYGTVAGSQYPRTTEIKQPNSKQGVRIRLDEFHSGAAAK